jgi:hypothetical protein
LLQSARHGSCAYCARPLLSNSSSFCIAWTERRAKVMAKAFPSSGVGVISVLLGTRNERFRRQLRHRASPLFS